MNSSHNIPQPIADSLGRLAENQPSLSTEFLSKQVPYVNILSNYWFLHNTEEEQKLRFEEQINKNSSAPYYEVMLNMINEDESMIEMWSN